MAVRHAPEDEGVVLLKGKLLALHRAGGNAQLDFVAHLSGLLAAWDAWAAMGRMSPAPIRPIFLIRPIIFLPRF
jgi:hypothetical protein